MHHGCTQTETGRHSRRSALRVYHSRLVDLAKGSRHVQSCLPLSCFIQLIGKDYVYKQKNRSFFKKRLNSNVLTIQYMLQKKTSVAKVERKRRKKPNIVLINRTISSNPRFCLHGDDLLSHDSNDLKDFAPGNASELSWLSLTKRKRVWLRVFFDGVSSSFSLSSPLFSATVLLARLHCPLQYPSEAGAPLFSGLVAGSLNDRGGICCPSAI